MYDFVKQPHPYFNDHGAVNWHTQFAEALAEAGRTGKRIFVEFGRLSCGSCMALVEGIIPRPEISSILNQYFVCLASDCDQPEPEIAEVGRVHMSYAKALPFCIFLDSEGKFVYGVAGARTVAGFRNDLEKALKKNSAG